ncbi:MAG: CRP/FNR family cyclic AMP-dependent transcriptional regulator [Gammaproteobacteria bacterium]
MDLLKEAELLRKVPMFSKLEGSKLKLLAFTSQLLSFDNEETLFLAGDPADCAYVIMKGEVDVLADTVEGEIVVTTLGRNDLCGEMAVLSKSTRTASIRASGHVDALRISDDAFIRLLTENPDVAMDVMKQLSDKIAKSFRQYEQLSNELQRIKQSTVTP